MHRKAARNQAALSSLVAAGRLGWQVPVKEHVGLLRVRSDFVDAGDHCIVALVPAPLALDVCDVVASLPARQSQQQLYTTAGSTSTLVQLVCSLASIRATVTSRGLACRLPLWTTIAYSSYRRADTFGGRGS